MSYPRTDCPACARDVAVYPVALRLSRHDPPEGRTPDLKSCPGSLTRHHIQPGEPGYAGEQDGLFDI
jgi:hypothetical protein